MANPYTSNVAPSGQVQMAMQLIAPELMADQVRISRQQQLAQMLKERGLAEDGKTEMVGGWAVKRNSIEGVSKLAQLLAGTYMQSKTDDQNTAIQKAFADKLAAAARGNGGRDSTSVAPVSSQGVSQTSGISGINSNDNNQLLATQVLYGDKAADVAADRLKEAPSVKESRQMGLTPEQMLQNYTAQQIKAGTQSFAPDQLIIGPNGQKTVVPNFKEGSYGGYDANGTPTFAEIPGANQIAASRAGAISAAQEGAKLMPADMTGLDNRPLGITQGEFLRGGARSNDPYSAADAKFGFPPGTMASIAKVESNNNPNAVSPKGAQGAFQIMPATQRDPGYGLPSLNPNDPMSAGSYLSKMIELGGGDFAKGVGMYNAGPKGDLSNPETQQYMQKVLGTLGQSTLAGGRPILQSAAEKQAALDAQKLQAAPALAKKTKDYEVASEREAGLANRISKSTDLMKRLKITEDALKEFQTGGGTEARAKVAEAAQIFGLPQGVIDKVAGGDLGAMQVVRKTALQESLLQMQQALATDSGASQKGNQMIMEEFMKSNPHLDTDPRAFEKLLNMMKDHHRSTLEESGSYFKYKSEGKDITEWPNYWAQQAAESGRVKAEPTNKHPYASKAKVSTSVQSLLDKYK